MINWLDLIVAIIAFIAGYISSTLLQVYKAKKLVEEINSFAKSSGEETQLSSSTPLPDAQPEPRKEVYDKEVEDGRTEKDN